MNSRCDSTVPPGSKTQGQRAPALHRACGSLAGVPMTRRFLSGNRFPLATESSMELHMSFFGSPFLLSEPPEAVV